MMKVDDKEFQQMKLAFKFMEGFGDPPAMGSDNGFWEKESDALTKWWTASGEHPLAKKLGLALHEYIEGRSFAKAYEERSKRTAAD